MLGTAATATLIRRAAERASSEVPNLRNLEISRENLVRYYKVPENWRTPGDPEAVREVQTLLTALRPLLTRLTGQVVLRRIDVIVSRLYGSGGERGAA